MYYCMWRVLVGLHEISFLPVGHTKFSPDWCFGLLKKKYRKMKIGCLDDIVKAVHQSGSPNVAQLVGTQGGKIMVPMYNWSEFFEDNTIKTTLKRISQMHHFHFKSSDPGNVLVKDSIDDKERTINLLKVPSWRPSSQDLPKVKSYHLGCHLKERNVYTRKYVNLCHLNFRIWYVHSQPVMTTRTSPM